MPAASFDFPSLSFHVPICGFAAKHATVAANDRAVTTAVSRVFMCGGDSGRNALGRQYQFQITTQDCRVVSSDSKHPSTNPFPSSGDEEKNFAALGLLPLAGNIQSTVKEFGGGAVAADQNSATC